MSGQNVRNFVGLLHTLESSGLVWLDIDRDATRRRSGAWRAARVPICTERSRGLVKEKRTRMDRWDSVSTNWSKRS